MKNCFKEHRVKPIRDSKHLQMFGGEDQKIRDMIHQNTKNKKTKKKVNMIFKR